MSQHQHRDEAHEAPATAGKAQAAERDFSLKSIDPAAQEMLRLAACEGISTAFFRVDTLKPCPIGHQGLCCDLCYMGPCRLYVRKGEPEITGICGAPPATTAARKFARAVAAGTSAHADHGRDLAFTLLATARGEAEGYQIKDEAKLRAVAGYLGIPTDERTKEEIGIDVATKVLAEYGQQRGELSYIARAPKKRQQLWRRLNLVPRGVDREVVQILHSTHEGTDQDPEHILHQAMRCALADGWGGSMFATDIADILFGTPRPILSQANLGVLKEDHVNIVVHGHEPALSALIVEAVREPAAIAYAQSKGAKGINLAGICCTSNEILMRQGIPAAGNFLHQELAILTGAVEAMVVDVQCIMHALSGLMDRFHTKLITTSEKAKIPGAMHLEYHPDEALRTARLIVKTAIDNYPNRNRKVQIPDEYRDLVAGFSHEYIRYMQGGTYRASFRPLNDAIMAGRIRGAAAVVGCNNPRVTQDAGIIKVMKDLISQDVLVVATGCGAIAAGKHGFLAPEMMEAAGRGLREVCEAVGIPPVLHLGSCVDNSRILTVLTEVVNEGGLGDDISDLPAVGLCPEWTTEKALAIATYCVASGAYVIFGVGSPVGGSPVVTDLLLRGWEEKVGGKLEFEPDYDKMVAKALAHIDAKRKALKLEEYDANRYGQSGDWRMREVLARRA